MEDDKSFSEVAQRTDDVSHGWQKVTYAKKQSKNQTKKMATDAQPNGSGFVTEKNSVFKGLEKHAEERHRKLEAQRLASSVYDVDDKIPVRSKKNRGDDGDEDYSSSENKENGEAEANKKEKKPKSVKKPKD